ncbi:MAG TPA: twin-arginine translocation pathway signal, partial [Rhodobacteraceae bacterium]|nr:twin-arginine translocation pathway signal [Paracoccaceae bacterium]
SRVLHNLRSNKGIEALGRFAAGSPQKGALIAISERTLDEAGNNRAWLLRQDRTAPLSVRRRDDYDITDAAVLPGGDLLILERKFRLLSGPAFRIRRIAATGIRAGAVLDGDVLIEADYSTTIDNMEGLALHRAANGELRLTLISDDNYSILQHTLLLQFALPGE